MTPFGQNWPASWTTDGTINGVSIGAGAVSSASSAISNSGASPNEVLDTECEVTVTYGTTITGGSAVIYVLREGSTGYESVTTDNPYSFTMGPPTASGTCKRVFTISGSDVGGFKVAIGNPASNNSITATLKTRQSQGQSG